MTIRRTTTALIAAALTLAACGGDDDTASADVEPAAEEPAAEPATDEAAATDAPTEDGDDDAEPAEQPAADEEEPIDEPAGDGDTIVARSLADVPDRCREQMAEFMRELEPFVAGIDWSSATLADLEQLGTDLESVSTDFEADSAAIGCDDIQFPDDNEFELLIEFAETEAPGVAGYFKFLDGLGMGGGDESADDDGATMELPVIGGEFGNCDEAIEFIQGLIDTYDSIADVPATELMAISGLGTVIGTCTPEQFEFLDSPEVNEFLGGL